MELPFRPRIVAGDRNLIKRFNPCFNGIAFSTLVDNHIKCDMMEVSILVLMELPFRLEALTD